MKSAPLPADELERQRALASYGVVDATQDEAFAALVRVASSVCEAPVAMVSVVEARRQWIVAAVGFDGITETPREVAFCAHAIHSKDIMVVEDATSDERFADNPLVLEAPHVRFYAGCPLIDKEGFALGTMCIIDRKPRKLSPLQASVLRELSTAVVRLLEAKRIDNALYAAEARAKRARAELAVVLDAASSTVAYWDADLKNRFANEAFLRFFGLPLQAVRGHHMRDVIGERLFAEAQGVIAGVLRGEPQMFERVLRSADGTERFASVTYTPDIQDGQVLGFIATTNDVTAPKRALQTSEQRNELLTLAEEVGEIGHWRIDVATGHLYWSPQVYRIHALDPATFVPTLDNAIEAYHPDDRERVTEVVRRAVEQKKPFDFELRVIRPDGTIRRVESRGRCQVDPATGNLQAVFGVFQDVTERYIMRDRLAQQERLVTTGTLAAGVGHEINNPLTYVTANIDFAIDEVRSFAAQPAPARTSEVLEVLAEAREGADRIRKIVRGLRAFAREDAPLAPTDVRAAVEIARHMAAHALRNRATLVSELADAPAVLADESRLSQVLVSLFVNAAQAFASTDDERNHITVRSARLADGRVAIDVEDNGPGIPSDVLPRIFDPFFTTKDVGGGTGLGLAIAHNVVSSMQGEITCTTHEGRGTTFRIALPAALPAAESTTESAPAEKTSATPRPRGRVMVIDDEPAVLRTVERSLRGEHDVVSFEDPREALRVLSEAYLRFDVILCDLTMAHMSGMELHARAVERAPELAERFVFLVGGTLDDATRRFLAEVPNERLEKPFSNQNLRGMARRFAASRG